MESGGPARRGRGIGRGRLRTRSPSGSRGVSRSPSRVSSSSDAAGMTTGSSATSASVDTTVASVTSDASSMTITSSPNSSLSGQGERGSDESVKVEEPAALPKGAIRGLHHSSSEDSDEHQYMVDPDYVVSRPEGKVKTGKRGTNVNMRANFYQLKKAAAWSLYQYHVSFEPEEDRTVVKKILFREVAKSLHLGYMFDGTQLYTAKLLTGADGAPLIPGESLSFQLQGCKNRGKPTEEKYDCAITIRLTKKLTTGSPVYNQLYNVLIKKCLFGMELELMGRNFFDPHAGIKLDQQRLELWPGYVTSMRVHEDEKVLLCVEVTHKVLRMDTVLQVIKQIGIRKNCANDRRALAVAVNAEIKDTIVMTTYNRKTYHVDDVDFSVSPKSTFESKGGPISYADYYKTRYGQEIQDMDQPLLVSKPSKRDVHRGHDKPAYLVPELCRSTGLTDDMRADFRLMKVLSEYLHQGPAARVKEIDHFMKRLMATPTVVNEFEAWGLQFEKNLTSLTGRIMPSEAIIFANDATQPVDQKGDFTLAFRSKQMLSSVNLVQWALLVPQRDAAGVDNLVKTMTKVAAPLNMRMSNPREIVKLADVRPQTYTRHVNDIVKKMPDIQMFFVVLPNNKLDLYASVKKRLAVDLGIPSQCFLAKNVVSKGLMSIATKVVVQMNAKMGGEPWTIKLPLKNTMFVGFDVYHGAKGSKSGSIGAMVATLSHHFTKYFSTTSTFQTNNDLAQNMRVDIAKCLKAYQEENSGVLPERIIIYRDGVGEGQLKHVYEVEIKEVQKELQKVYLDAGQVAAKLTFIVVSKRINTRVFLTKQQTYDNPPPGCVVDSVVTMPERMDFYLISCAARQGTVSPCSYNVLQDDSDMEPDRLQVITYKLCHMYFNWSGTIAVPAPCQYAHKLAFLTGMAYSGHAHQNLNKLLHFL